MEEEPSTVVDDETTVSAVEPTATEKCTAGSIRSALRQHRCDDPELG